MKDRIRVFLFNLSRLPQRMMANHLRKRGWVAFYLEKEARKCNQGCCWLAIYEYEVKK